MRYDPQHKQQTRERILAEAAREIRAAGPHQVAVAGIMARAGLTHGGFYAHFESKDDLIAAAIAQMFAEGRARIVAEMDGRSPAEGLARYIDFYLSRGHRDARTAGCPLPFLAPDLPRLSERARENFAAGVAGLRGRLAMALKDLGQADPDAEASSLLAEMVGALALARAEPDADASDAILARSKRSLKRRFGLEA